MSVSAEMIWDSAQSLLRSRIAPETYDLWFQPVQAIDLSDDCITLQVINEFSDAWLKDHHFGVLREVLAQAAKRPLQVKLKVGGGVANGVPSSVSGSRNPEAERLQAEDASSARGGRFNSNYRFESFVVGTSNDFAQAAALAVAQAPGQIYNPLFLYGDVGLGKTHLLQAIGRHVADHKKKARVMYRSSEEFTNEYIDSIQKSELSRFRKACRQTDLLLIDDVQFLSGKERIQEEFFHTFNALYDGRKQIVLTCDRPASELPNLQKRLVSRFEGGLVAGLELPDVETRGAILRKQQEALGVELSDEVLQFIAGCIRTNVRRLEGARSEERRVGKECRAGWARDR